MGLFEGMKRMIQGKPVFDVNDDNDWGRDDDDTKNQNQRAEKAADNYNPSAVTAAAQHTGPKVLPRVEIEKINCNLNGDRMDCYFAIQNNSTVRVEVDKITILGTTRELDNFLNPGEEREFLVFSGKRPANNYANKCELYYKDPTGDYFMSQHSIDFEREHDGTYYIYRVTFNPPVRDV